MLIHTLQPHHIFIDPNGKPWPRGTIIVLEPFPQHCGLLDYTQTGDQILLHKSKREGRATVTGPKGFMDNPVRYRVKVPDSNEQANQRLSYAYAAIGAGEPWDFFDNCQDFISLAAEGHAGSPTRDAVLGGLAFVGVLGLAAKLFS